MKKAFLLLLPLSFLPRAAQARITRWCTCERAQSNSFPIFNTSLKAGDQYAEEFSRIIKPVVSYFLLTVSPDKQAQFDLKTLDDSVLDITFSGPKSREP